MKLGFSDSARRDLSEKYKHGLVLIGGLTLAPGGLEIQIFQTRPWLYFSERSRRADPKNPNFKGPGPKMTGLRYFAIFGFRGGTQNYKIAHDYTHLKGLATLNSNFRVSSRKPQDYCRFCPPDKFVNFEPLTTPIFSPFISALFPYQFNHFRSFFNQFFSYFPDSFL